MINLVLKEYGLASDYLSNESSRRTLIFISKIQEELGQVCESLTSLADAYKFCETKKDFKMILTQELRLMSYLGFKNKIIDKMSVLSQKYENSYSDKVEILHALLWSEYCLFGFADTSKIFLRLVGENLSDSDSRLTYRDFLEIVCLAHTQKNDIILTAIQKFKKKNNLQSFDLFLIDYLTLGEVSDEYLFNSDLSVMQKIRLLNIISNSVKTLELAKAKYYKQFVLLTQHLSLDNQRILKNLMPQQKTDSCAPLIVELNRFTDLQKKILILFETKSAYDLTELTIKIWGENYSALHYDRLRMLVYKLNKSMISITPSAVFTITKNEIKLNQKIKIAA